MFLLVLLLFVDDSPIDGWDALDDDGWQHFLEGLHHEVHAVSVRIIWLNVQFAVVFALDVFRLELHLSCFKNSFDNLINRKFKFERLNNFNIQLNTQIASLRRIHLLNIFANVSKQSCFESAFDDSCGDNVVLIYQICSNNWSANNFCGIDNFIDSWHTKSYVHAGNSRKMKCFQGHLRSWLTNGLGADCTHALAGLNYGFSVLLPDKLGKLLKLGFCYMGEISQLFLQIAVFLLPFEFGGGDDIF